MRGWMLVGLLLAAAGTRGGEMPERESEAARALHALIDEQWEYWMREHPTWASSLGDRRYNDRWPQVSPAAYERRARHDAELLERVRAIDPQALGAADRLNRELLMGRLEQELEEHRYGSRLLAVNQRGGIQTAYELAESLRFETVRDHEDWLARLRAVDTYVEQTIALLRAGLERGVTQPRILMQRIPDQLEPLVAEAVEANPWYEPFTHIPEELPAAEAERLRAAARAAVAETVIPAYRRFQRFFLDDYLPVARDSVAARELPEGEGFYRWRVRRYTNSGLSPDEIHQLGLDEVARIRAEMQRVIDESGFEGSFAEFLEFLRGDPRFYAADADELLTRYREVCKRIDPELVKLFGKLPRMPYGVRPIPEQFAPDTTTAYYSGPAADGSRAGTYWVNLYRPEVRPLYEIEALSVHEAVPGHHLQIALAMELEGLPRFRRHGGYTAFVEGWALYAESLGEELGLYQDPYSKFGQLTYEMWRAVRLVVDTGLHWKGWSRQQAIDYFKANAAKSEHDIVNEIDRYIGWPGQALAYKIGELKIKQLRRRAEQQLGERFELRGFHDRVLEAGAVPLDVLERQVTSWIDERRAEPPAGRTR